MSYRLVTSIVAAVLSGMLTAAHADESVTVRLKWFHQAQFAGFYVANDKGLYKSAGLNVDIQPGGPDFPAIQMVAGGSEQFGVTGADQILIARSKGVPVVALAVIFRRNPFVLFSLAKSGIKTPADYVGKKVGVKIGGHANVEAEAFQEAVVAMPEVVACHLVSGEADYLLEVVVPDLEHYQRFLVGKLLALPIVREVRSNIAIQTLKAGAPLPLGHLGAQP